MSFINVSPEDFKKQDEQTIYKSIILNHFARCIAQGTVAEGKQGIRTFERAIKMLEACIGHRISRDYQAQIIKLIEKGQDFIKADNLEGYFEILRLRFMLITQELSFLGYMPEERAIDKF